MKTLPRWGLALVAVATMSAAEPAADDDEDMISADDVYAAGKNLFDELAPPEVKEQFEFPDKARWDDVMRRLQAALEGSDPQALVPFESEVRTALAALRNLPGGDEYADWVAERLDYIEAAKELLTQYLAQQPHIAKASGVSEEIVKKVQSILGWPATREQIHEAMRYVPDDFVLKISATGTPEEARAKVEEYKRRGCTCPILYPMSDPYLMIDTFAV